MRGAQAHLVAKRVAQLAGHQLHLRQRLEAPHVAPRLLHVLGELRRGGGAAAGAAAGRRVAAATAGNAFRAACCPRGAGCTRSGPGGTRSFTLPPTFRSEGSLSVQTGGRRHSGRSAAGARWNACARGAGGAELRLRDSPCSPAAPLRTAASRRSRTRAGGAPPARHPGRRGGRGRSCRLAQAGFPAAPNPPLPPPPPFVCCPSPPSSLGIVAVFNCWGAGLAMLLVGAGGAGMVDFHASILAIGGGCAAWVGRPGMGLRRAAPRAL